MTAAPAHGRLRDALYAEAMLLADEARSYFDEVGRSESGRLDAIARVAFACESLKVTTRLMHIVSWLLTRRAVDAGEIEPAQVSLPEHRLGDQHESDPDVVKALPARARELVEASVDLHRRVQHLDRAEGEIADSPARAIQDRLTRSF